MQDFFFFLSYAHGGEEDQKLVGAFFQNLCAELRVRIGRDPDQPIGYLDEEMRVGSTWPPEVTDALATSRTFIALCSPRYFLSEVCGQEWAVFSRRLAAYTRATGRRAPALIPLFWIDTQVPGHLGDIHHRDRTFGDAYRKFALRDLMRITANNDEYLLFVTAVARLITAVAADHQLPPLEPRPELRAVRSAFSEPSAAQVPAPRTPAVKAPRAGDDRSPRQGANPPPKQRPRPILSVEPPDVTDKSS